MRKVKIIQQKLNIYAEQCKPSAAEMLSAAKAELAKKQALVPDSRRGYGTTPNRDRRKMSWAQGFALMVAGCMLLLFGVMQTTRTGNDFDASLDLPTIAPYTLLQLQFSTADEAELDSAAGKDILRLNAPTESFTVNAGLYLQKEDLAVRAAALKYRIISDFGMDELLLIADIGGNMQDYADTKTLPGRLNYSGITLFGELNLYYNGEYYSSLYFKYQNTDYYLIIMSPSPQSAEYYIPLIIGEQT